MEAKPRHNIFGHQSDTIKEDKVANQNGYIFAIEYL